MKRQDWADKLADREISRGNTKPKEVIAEEFRSYVRNVCAENIERWDKNNELQEEKLAAIKEETKRLIKLKKEEDIRKELEYQYSLKGIEVNACYTRIGEISSVKLNLPSDEWVDLLNRDGENLPSCCADISRIRDLLTNACQNEHIIETNDLWEIYVLAKNHGFKKSGPIGKIMKLWEQVKNDASTFKSHHRKIDLNDPKDAIKALASACDLFEWEGMMEARNRSDDVKFQNKVNKNKDLALIAAAVNTLFYKLKDLDIGPVEGFGIVGEEGVEQSYSGLSIFRTQEIANMVCEKWNKELKDNLPKNKSLKLFTVKKCRVSMSHGVEILESSN